MKSITLFLLLFPFGLFAQQDWPVIGAQWVQNDGYYYEYPYTYTILECTGDTIINNLSYRIIENGWDIETFIHQDGDQFYYLFNDSLQLLYDFDVAMGDTVIFDLFSADYLGTDTIFSMPYRIDSLTQIITNGISLDRVYTTNLGDITTPGIPYRYNYTERIGYDRRIFENEAGLIYIADAGPETLRCYFDHEIEFHSNLYYFLEIDSCFATEPPNAVINIDNEEITISIHPNPVSQTAKINLETTASIQELAISLFNLNGQMLLFENRNFAQEIQIDVSPFPSGIYFLTFQFENTIWTEKINIQY